MTTTLDLTTLAWCLPEIRSSLLKAEECLQTFHAQPSEDNKAPLQAAIKAIYQAHGALRVIGVAGVDLLTGEAQTLLTSIENGELTDGKLLKPTLLALNASFSAVIGYLESLEQGNPEQPLYLFVYYRDLLLCKGVERVHPSELFFPTQQAELDIQSAGQLDLTDAARATAKSEFERGLLKFLRGTASDEASSEMYASVALFEAEHRNSPDRKFWIASMAFFESLKAGGYGNDPMAKKLLARFNSHLKTVLPGAATSEKLLKEVLFSLACATKLTPLVDAVRQAYGLKANLPSDFEVPRFAILNRSAIAISKDSLAKIKALLDKVVRGNADDIVPFCSATEMFFKATTQLPAGGLQPSAKGLLTAANALKTDSKLAMSNEAMLLELATVVLFAETILDEGVKASTEQHGQGVELAGRIDAALKGTLARDLPMPPWLQVLSQSAQERITVATFISEAQINLRSVEKSLDAFFRDSAEKKELSPCGSQLRQVAGALALLGHNDAMLAAQALASRVDKMVAATTEPDKVECDSVAESLGALGFFVDRLGQKDDSVSSFTFDAATGSFGINTAVQAQASQKAVRVTLNEPSAVPALPAVAAVVVPVAAVIVPAAAVAVVAPALFADVAPAAVPVVVPTLPALATISPLATSTAKVLSDDEKELREIFLMEAQEVLEAIEENSSVFRNSPNDQDALTTMRRAYHTLKGSSRMVGLNEFGEAGWAMEQLLNLWLSEKRAGTDPLFELIDHSHGVFTGWVQALESGNDAAVQPADLVARATAVQNGEAYVPIQASVVIEAAPVAETLPEIAPVLEAAPTESLVFETVAFEEPAFELPAFEEPPVNSTFDVFDISSPLPAEPAPLLFDEPLFEASMPDENVKASAFEVDAFEADATEVSAFADELVFEPVAELVSEPTAVFEPAFDPVFENSIAEELSDRDDIRIGDHSISRALFNIFLSEADDMLSVLTADASDWLTEAPRLANKEARRAIHSIAGSANLVGLGHVSEVAHQLDLFLQRHLTAAVFASPRERGLYHLVIERVAGMLHQFAGGKQPKEDLDLFADAVALAAGVHSDQPIEIDTLDFDQVEMSDLLKADMLAVEEASLFADEPALFEAEPSLFSDEPSLFADEVAETNVADSVPSFLSIPAGVVATVATSAVVAKAYAAAPETDFNHTSSLLAPPGHVSARDDSFSIEDNHFDADLLPVFIEEAEDYLPKIATSLRMWLESPENLESPRNLMRLMHTVKGSARMAGAMELGQRVHEMETRIEDATDAVSSVAAGQAKIAVIEGLLTDHDHIVALFESIKDPAVLAAQIAKDAASGTIVGEDFIIDDAPTTIVESAAALVALSATVGALASLTGPISNAKLLPATAPEQVTAQLVQGQQQGGNGSLVRVRADILDRMVSDAGEASIARARVENELTGMRQALSDLSENVTRLRSQLREIEVQAESQIQARIALNKETMSDFDPLEFDRFTRFQEVSRMLAESVNDVATVQQNSMKGLDEAHRDLQRQSQVMRELQQNLMRIRLVQVGSIGERLYRVVRQAAKETNKKVNLDIRGATTEIDRSVLERMASAFEHLLRNAVAHGIEAPAQRLAARKSETGEIVFEIKQMGNEIVVVLSDNGGGLDYPRIRERAIARGLVVVGSNPTERELAQMIFMPGFTTATTVTEIAGRGVGMDVVRSEVAALGGRLDTDSTAGLGTRFTITLPLSLAVTQVVVIESGQHRYAVASASVEQILQLKPQALVSAYADQGIDWQGERVPVVHLASLLDLSDKSPVAQHYSPVVMVKIGERRIALHVDSVTKNQEVVLKNMGPQLARVDGVVGATVMGNGDIVLIINPVQFADRMGLSYRSSNDQRMAQSLLRDAKQDFTVMVVDDSVTVRKVSQRFLAREGYQVMLAKDGVDALRHLQDQMPDVMLVDIEMPRMDGYDFTRAIRADQRLKHIPIIMITSRTADKHRNYAISLGVNAYMGKPYSESELAETIKTLLANPGSGFVSNLPEPLLALN